ncbi:hypothetical protein F2Q70_00039574 [Brassica cretica]|uniref:Uncharacterized protein n=1 Tax=Brassica cretica TaxID=69181 RepID=A0A8S9JLK5_BRACR|nr:hypothetical protein F2Q68_00004320 [Brassica cretica]KAF2588008.1 hypothetical protein F2Q70_00039574 [Brassica cretica]
MAGNTKWVRYGLREIASKGRRECMDQCLRCFERARSLHSERAERTLGRYVATGQRACAVVAY